MTVNALSPIANTRMVAAALERARAEGRAGGGGGLSLDAIPGPENLGPLAAYLVSEEAAWCSGQVFFAGGPEVAVVDQPRLVEVVRTEGVASLAGVLDAAVPRAFVTAETKQATDGGANPRFGSIFDAPAPAEPSAGDVRSCAIVSERADLTAALTAALEARSIACQTITPRTRLQRRGSGFAGHRRGRRVRAVRRRRGRPGRRMPHGPADGPAAPVPADWEAVLADHRELVAHLQADAAWTRAVADHAAESERPVRIVTLTDATTPGGRSRGQAAAQIARAAAGGTGRRVTALAASLESSQANAAERSGELVANLLAHPEANALAGAELVVGPGWLGLRAHPRPIGTVVYGGPEIPEWMDGALREIVGATGAGREEQPREQTREQTESNRTSDDRHARKAHESCRRTRPPLGPCSNRLVPVPLATGATGRGGDQTRRRHRHVPTLRRRHVPG